MTARQMNFSHSGLLLTGRKIGVQAVQAHAWKKMDPVAVPLLLKLGELLGPAYGAVQYRLVGFITHTGSASVEHGHYAAVVRTCRPNEWLTYDDAAVSQPFQDPAASQMARSASILHYERAIRYLSSRSACMMPFADPCTEIAVWGLHGSGIIGWTRFNACMSLVMWKRSICGVAARRPGCSGPCVVKFSYINTFCSLQNRQHLALAGLIGNQASVPFSTVLVPFQTCFHHAFQPEENRMFHFSTAWKPSHADHCSCLLSTSCLLLE